MGRGPGYCLPEVYGHIAEELHSVMLMALVDANSHQPQIQEYFPKWGNIYTGHPHEEKDTRFSSSQVIFLAVLLTIAYYV